MLVWIKTPCVAIGVLAIFLFLLSAAVSEEFRINTTFEEYTTTTLNGLEEEIETVQLMQLPFASSLVNPCAEGASNRPYIAAEGHRASFTVEFFRFISHYASLYKEDAEEVLRNYTVNGCVALHVTNLPDTPTFKELQEMGTEDALNKIYSSLLTHAAYAYFIHHQFTNSALRCSEGIYDEQSLSNQSLNLGIKQRSLACYVRVGISVLGYTQRDYTSLLNDTVTNLSLCSRRALRDCQVMTSIYNVLQSIEDYASDLS